MKLFKIKRRYSYSGIMRTLCVGAPLSRDRKIMLKIYQKWEYFCASKQDKEMIDLAEEVIREAKAEQGGN